MKKPTEELKELRDLLELERREELRRYEDKFRRTALEDRIKEGVTWYPLKIVAQEFGLGDRLMITLERPVGQSGKHAFQGGSIAALFAPPPPGKKVTPSITGVIARVKKNQIKLVLEKDELPEWAEEGRLGLDLYFDERSYVEMDKALASVISASNNRLADLRDILLGQLPASFTADQNNIELEGLNPSQNEALNLVRRAEDTGIIHGPPGTGKTTTLVRAIRHTLKSEGRVLVCAASNLAVDLLTERLAEQGVKVLRIGHPARVSETILRHSLDTQFALHPGYRDMKGLRREAQQLKEQAQRWKRSFGHAERRQRGELWAQYGRCMKDARLLEEFILHDLVDKAQAITCTLVGSAHSLLIKKRFRTLFVDEAAQALEPATWIPVQKVQRIIFAGDHCQLPPTVKSREAEKKGMGVSLFEKVMDRQQASSMLQVQYRMHEKIMAFSNDQFYAGNLRAAPAVANWTLPGAGEDYQSLAFIDTAGAGYDEEQNPETLSLANPGEAEVVFNHLSNLLAEQPKPDKSEGPSLSIGIVSPYKEQVAYLRAQLTEQKSLWPWLKGISVDTVDGFQGQERDIIYISMVRSNRKGIIGFLADTRRMNVAMTRARKKLVLIGDSATLGTHPFYQAFLDFVEAEGAWSSIWDHQVY